MLARMLDACDFRFLTLTSWSFDFYDEEVGWHLYIGPFLISYWRCPS